MLTILSILEACSQAVLLIETGILLLLALVFPVRWPLDGPLPWGTLGSRTARYSDKPTAGAATASVLPPGPPSLQAGGSWWGWWGLQVGHTQHALDGLLSAGGGWCLTVKKEEKHWGSYSSQKKLVVRTLREEEQLWQSRCYKDKNHPGLGMNILKTVFMKS